MHHIDSAISKPLMCESLMCDCLKHAAGSSAASPGVALHSDTSNMLQTLQSPVAAELRASGMDAHAPVLYFQGSANGDE